jgi:ABC-type multidrug transport system ATPase subunit
MQIVRHLDMSVPSGNIYGLLGSSGCGKTTLLRCVLGRLTLASGQVTVLGKPPGAKGHKVPGRDVGYMPQVSVYYYADLCMVVMEAGYW